MFTAEEEKNGTKRLVENVRNKSTSLIGEVVVNKNIINNIKNNNYNNKMIALNGYKAAAYVDMNTKQDSSIILGTHGLGNKGLSQSDRGEGIWSLKAELSRLEKRKNELTIEINNSNNNNNNNDDSNNNNNNNCDLLTLNE